MSLFSLVREIHSTHLLLFLDALLYRAVLLIQELLSPQLSVVCGGLLVEVLVECSGCVSIVLLSIRLLFCGQVKVIISMIDSAAGSWFWLCEL